MDHSLSRSLCSILDSKSCVQLLYTKFCVLLNKGVVPVSYKGLWLSHVDSLCEYSCALCVPFLSQLLCSYYVGSMSVFVPLSLSLSLSPPPSSISGAEQVYFELPRLNSRLLSSVKTVQQYGKATLTFSRLELGHQASYICHAVSVRRHLEKRVCLRW